MPSVALPFAPLRTSLLEPSLLILGFAGSSSVNFAQENSDCCGSGAQSAWPLPSNGTGELPLAWCPMPRTNSTVGPVPWKATGST